MQPSRGWSWRHIRCWLWGGGLRCPFQFERHYSLGSSGAQAVTKTRSRLTSAGIPRTSSRAFTSSGSWVRPPSGRMGSDRVASVTRRHSEAATRRDRRVLFFNPVAASNLGAQSAALLNLEAMEVVSSPSWLPRHTYELIANKKSRHDWDLRFESR